MRQGKTKRRLNQRMRNPTAPEDEEADSRGPQSPDAEQTSFRLADPDLRIELVASEPDVVSPVAIAWDADGRMYVAEMSGYPATEGMGRIRRLEDRDGDGRYEHAVTFCDGMNFPTSVMPYRDGLLVTDAPDILYLEDTDGDGRADVRRVEWTGFGTGSQQLRANSLHWGLDNWIYVANGRCDGDVRRPDTPPDQATSIRARDFRFHPISNAGEAILGQSQFGQAHDAWGNRFLSWNTIPSTARPAGGSRRERISQRQRPRQWSISPSRATRAAFIPSAPGHDSSIRNKPITTTQCAA